MTLQNAIDLIKRLSHRGDTAVTSSDGNVTQTIIDCINVARKDVYLQLPRRWLRKTSTASLTSSSSATISLSADVMEPFMFWYTLSDDSDHFLRKVSDEKEFYQLIFRTSTARQLPQYYFDSGWDATTFKRQVIIFPNSDRTITLNYHYYKKYATEQLTTSVLTSEIEDIPDQFHNAVWKGGLYYFLKSFDDPAQGVAKQDFGESLAQIQIMEESDQDDDNSGFRMGPMSIKRY